MCGTWVLRLNGCPFPASLKGQQGVGGQPGKGSQASLFVNPSAPANKVFQFLSHNKRHQVFAAYLPQHALAPPPLFQLPATSTFVAPRENEIMNVRWHNRTPDTKAKRSALLTWHRFAAPSFSTSLSCLPVPHTMRVCAHFSVKVS